MKGANFLLENFLLVDRMGKKSLYILHNINMLKLSFLFLHNTLDLDTLESMKQTFNFALKCIVSNSDTFMCLCVCHLRVK